MHSNYHRACNDLSHRRTHHKRFSISKLSSETVQTLPEYSASPRRCNSADQPPFAQVESDRPPDYPKTTDEADADTEGDREDRIVYVQHHIVHPSTRRSPSHIRRRKRPPTAAPDPFLDMLLERSVHALEMSNTLLRSTMSTQSSLSALLSSENEPDHFLEVRAQNLSTRIRVSSGVHETWMDHLQEISKGVDTLFGEEGKGFSSCRVDEQALSQSLPITTVPELRHRRKPSILELNKSSNSHLRYSHPTRDLLVSPAPRALTQYVESTADPQSIILPSTLGVQAYGSSHSLCSREAPSACHQNTQSPAIGISSGIQTQSTTPAYTFLSSLTKHSESPARSSHSYVGCASSSPTRKARGKRASFSSSSTRTVRPSSVGSRPEREVQVPRSRSERPRRSSTSPAALPTIPVDEELSPSSDSSDHPTGYRTVQSLRKILDDHPSSTSVHTLRRKEPTFLHAPSFLPATPPPVAIQGTSTATASVSRLYTKNRHSMSTRPPSPPVHSSLKVRSVTPTPCPSPSTKSVSDVFGSGVARVMGSASSSGVSTPKRISFAELPESYSGSNPGTSKLRERKNRKKNKQGKIGDKETGGWLATLLRVGLSSGELTSTRRREERIEERMARGWGSRPGYGTLDDWAV